MNTTAANPGPSQPLPPVAPAAHVPAPRPVDPDELVEYHRVIAATKPRVWRGIVALVLLVVGMLVFSLAFGMLGGLAFNLTVGDPERVGTSPWVLGPSMFALALLTPWSMLLQRWFFGLPFPSLSSIRGMFRFDLFGRALVVLLPIWSIYLVLTSGLMPASPAVEWPVVDALGMLLVVLVLTPLQATGEEYGFRGLAFRIAASWGRGPRSGLVIGVIVSSLVFMSAHLAMDPWLNLYYFTFGASLALIAWRTGGIEIAIVLHAVNNTVAFLSALVLRSDMLAGFDRSAGVANAVMLVPCALLVAVLAAVWIATAKRGPARAPLRDSLRTGDRRSAAEATPAPHVSDTAAPATAAPATAAPATAAPATAAPATAAPAMSAPTAPAAPTSTTWPTTPASPTNPASPTTPASPSTPASPTTPASPSTQASPSTANRPRPAAPSIRDADRGE